MRFVVLRRGVQRIPLAVSVSTPSSETDPTCEPSSARWFADHVYVYDPELKSYLRQVFPDARNEVDDVVQESYLRIWKARAGRPLVSAKAFLFKVARHVALDFLRRRHISSIESAGNLNTLSVIEERLGISESVSMDEMVRLLGQSLATLPRRGREVMILRKFKCLSQKEVATQLGISEKTVDEHLCRGMKKLGASLRERGICSFYDP